MGLLTLISKVKFNLKVKINPILSLVINHLPFKVRVLNLEEKNILSHLRSLSILGPQVSIHNHQSKCIIYVNVFSLPWPPGRMSKFGRKMHLNTVKIPFDYLITRVIHNHQRKYIIGMREVYHLERFAVPTVSQSQPSAQIPEVFRRATSLLLLQPLVCLQLTHENNSLRRSRNRHSNDTLAHHILSKSKEVLNRYWWSVCCGTCTLYYCPPSTSSLQRVQCWFLIIY